MALSERCPDLTAKQVEWLRETYPLPVWDGRPETAADYHRRVGIHELTESLAHMLSEEADSEDAQAAPY